MGGWASGGVCGSEIWICGCVRMDLKLSVFGSLGASWCMCMGGCVGVDVCALVSMGL